MSPEYAHILPRPRDSLRSTRDSAEEVIPGLEIANIDMLASFSIRRCMDVSARDKLYEQINLSDIIENLGAIGAGFVCYPGIMIGKRMRPRANKTDEARLQQVAKLQQYCENTRPIDLEIERFGVYGNFVSMIPAWDSRIAKEPGVISKLTGLKGSSSGKSLISIVQNAERAEAKKIRDGLNEQVETPFRVVVERPVLFSGKTPIVVHQDGVHPTTLV